MVVGGIEERIKKMKEAILTEAKQRAASIVENAVEEAGRVRSNLVDTEKEKINHEHNLAKKNEEVKAKIEKSSVINRQRIRKMEVRHKMVETLREDVIKELVRRTQQPSFKPILKHLIVQGLLKMMERNVCVEARKDQSAIIASLFAECQHQFTAIIEKETGKKMETSLTISEYSLQEKHQHIIGGIFLRSSDGSIVCDNSLDSRVRLIFEQRLPSIREHLFGLSSKPQGRVKH